MELESSSRWDAARFELMGIHDSNSNCFPTFVQPCCNRRLCQHRFMHSARHGVESHNVIELILCETIQSLSQFYLKCYECLETIQSLSQFDLKCYECRETIQSLSQFNSLTLWLSAPCRQLLKERGSIKISFAQTCTHGFLLENRPSFKPCCSFCAWNLRSRSNQADAICNCSGRETPYLLKDVMASKTLPL